ncbi:terpene synthase family protein [Kitasatospora sp. NPDC018058]|uniref:terpene synthase family protein n=1 Tax=Kitasatospora sp. NPDC018058 TaxID=3364025 RepID=UPI0037C07C86
MADNSSASAALGPEAVLPWASEAGLVADARGERRLASMRLDVLAGGALPQGNAADVALTTQWAAFICWVDDQIDRRGLGSVPGELERFTAPLRRVLASDTGPPAAAPHAVVLAGLWERTAAGMSARWRSRFTADYTDFLDACAQEVALRRAGVRPPLADYLALRRRTITLLPMLDVLERTGHAPSVEDPRVDARLQDLRWAVADVAGWANDLASAADDEAAGQDNLVALLARQDDCSTGTARLRAAAMIEERRAGMRATVAALRAEPGLPQDRREELRRYMDLVETFMAATLHWLTVTGRFACDAEPATYRSHVPRS